MCGRQECVTLGNERSVNRQQLMTTNTNALMQRSLGTSNPLCYSVHNTDSDCTSEAIPSRSSHQTDTLSFHSQKLKDCQRVSDKTNRRFQIIYITSRLASPEDWLKLPGASPCSHGSQIVSSTMQVAMG